MNLLHPVLAAVVLTFGASLASAQNQAELAGRAQCQQTRPSDPPCRPVPSSEASMPGGDLSERTHAMILPTGNLLRKGQAQIQVNELGLYNRVAYGVSDRVEVSAGMLIPWAVSAGIKVALVEPSGSTRLVAGATIWKLTFDENDSTSVVQGGFTAAYQGKQLTLHASLEGMRVADDSIVGYSAGALLRVSRKLAISAEYLHAGVSSQPDFRGELLVGGIKVMSENWDIDLGVATPLGEGSDSSVMLPVLAASNTF